MSSAETVTLTRVEYEALLNLNSELEDRLAALEAEDGSASRMRWLWPSYAAKAPSLLTETTLV